MTITVDLPAPIEAVWRPSSPPAEDTATIVAECRPGAATGGRNSKRERSLALLRSVATLGRKPRQETFTYLQSAIDEDRLSDRKRFA